MKIKITSAKSTLKVGEEYDLCDQAANTLIGKGQAQRVIEKPADETDPAAAFADISDEQLREKAGEFDEIKLTANMKRSTIIKKLIAAGFVPSSGD